MIKSISSQKSKTYVGYTNNIQNRLLQHNSNKGAKSTKGYRWKIIFIKNFSYNLKKKLISATDDVKIYDVEGNKYFVEDVYIDLQNKRIIGNKVKVALDPKSFGLPDEENDPRFVANDIFMSKNESNFTKGVFTICQQKEDRCPPWSLQAKKINHDKIKKTIYYEKATLKVYDFPIFYFPKFFHPDPTVKRQSGFLSPIFTNSTNLGVGFGLPYYWSIGHDKDLTFTPKVYANENVLFLNEYRQAFRNGLLTLDTSYTKGYKNTSATKTKGSRNHIFAELDFDLSQDQSYESDLSFKIQSTSNDTFFRIHDINTTLVSAQDTDLELSLIHI